MTTQLDTPSATALDRASVAEAMHAGVVTCSPGTPLALVAQMMASHRIHSVRRLGRRRAGRRGRLGRRL